MAGTGNQFLVPLIRENTKKSSRFAVDRVSFLSHFNNEANNNRTQCSRQQRNPFGFEVKAIIYGQFRKLRREIRLEQTLFSGFRVSLNIN